MDGLLEVDSHIHVRCGGVVSLLTDRSKERETTLDKPSFNSSSVMCFSDELLKVLSYGFRMREVTYMQAILSPAASHCSCSSVQGFPKHYSTFFIQCQSLITTSLWSPVTNQPLMLMYLSFN